MAKPVLTPEQIKAISQGSPTEIAQVLTSLVQQFQVLQTEVNELKRQLGRNSGNSHMPPSSDGPKQKAERSSTPRVYDTLKRVQISKRKSPTSAK